MKRRQEGHRGTKEGKNELVLVNRTRSPAKQYSWFLSNCTRSSQDEEDKKRERKKKQ